MAKPTTHFVCSNCGYDSVKWYGKCPSCSSWNTMTEFDVTPKSAKTKTFKTSASKAVSVNEIETPQNFCISTHYSELDRVLGGGVFGGSLVLTGGEPGVGKSTLFLQVLSNIAKSNKVLYISGEESLRQVKLRANRINALSENLLLSTETEVNEIISRLIETSPSVAVIDSIQTLFDSFVNSSAGSTSQIRECCAKLIAYAKEYGCAVFLIGHVTKDGTIAGPRVLEHMVDTVLYFEGNNTHKVLRCVKNRFGPVNEIGVFEMTANGMKEITDFSGVFISEHNPNGVGSCIFCALEGTRPVLCEVQALVSKTTFNLPRRVSTGIDYNRCLLIAAVLEKRAGLKLSEQDIYLNIAGGLRLNEPAADLSAALAIISSYKNKSVGSYCAMGEIGLTGEVRSIGSIQNRIIECRKMGYKKIIVPKKQAKDVSDTDVIGIGNIWDLVELVNKQ